MLRPNQIIRPSIPEQTFLLFQNLFDTDDSLWVRTFLQIRIEQHIDSWLEGNASHSEFVEKTSSFHRLIHKILEEKRKNKYYCTFPFENLGGFVRFLLNALRDSLQEFRRFQTSSQIHRLWVFEALTVELLDRSEFDWRNHELNRVHKNDKQVFTKETPTVSTNKISVGAGLVFKSEVT